MSHKASFVWTVFSFIAICLVSVAATGCGGGAESMISYAKDSAPASKRAYKSNSEAGFTPDAVQSASAGKLPVDRKIIFKAKLTAYVEDLSGIGKKVDEAVEKFGGYVSSSSMDSLKSYRPSGTWVVRVPVEKFHDFLSSAKSLGTVDDIRIESDDVTEEYVDSEARLKNQRKLEERILKLLQRPEDEIQHVIKVEAELARIREVIERIEGRLRFLKDRVSFSTVTIRIVQERSFVPKEKRTFSSRVATAWNSSWEDAQRGVENFFIRAARQAPFWIFFVVVILPVSFFTLRWIKRKVFA